MTETKDNRIGFIGLGVMGHSMAGHLLDKGYEMRLYTRTKAKADDLVAKGAVWCDTVAELAAASDIVITIVGYPADVEQVYLGGAGIFENSAPGTMAIDMTTSDPGLAERLWAAGSEKGIQVLDAPVSGGDLGARNATLSIMVGGDKEAFDRALPVLEVMGKNIVYQGKAGSGQHTKMANQIAIAAGMVAVCESLAYAKRSGLDPETVLASIGQGAAGSWSLNNLGPRIINEDDQPGFFIKHFIKDMGIAVESARRMNLDTPGLDLAYSLYKKMAEMGFEDNGTQALYKLFQ
ncbi:MAG TPA: oxidoreductase [Desulfobacteraceae bacterium]|nr:oxidoreductase [Desulfobacteraceae bacterium]|tara:strand:- start:226 stop:1101 length:876 start_codon:yes stop_codon:yes gene_type:complete